MRKISLNPSFFMVFSLFVLGACHGDPEQKASVCGDEVIENGEICDGDQFGQATCVSEGFAAGALACSATCEIDTAGCIPAGCGDGAALDGEHCDGADLRGKTCEDRGFLGGYRIFHSRFGLRRVLSPRVRRMSRNSDCEKVGVFEGVTRVGGRPFS